MRADNGSDRFGDAIADTSEAFETSFPAYIFSDSLPLLLWAIIAHRVVGDFATRAMQQVAPSEGEQKS